MICLLVPALLRRARIQRWRLLQLGQWSTLRRLAPTPAPRQLALTAVKSGSKMQGRGNLGWFHMQVLKEVMEQVAFDDFVLASNPCESASLAPVCTARCSQAWHSLPAQAGCGHQQRPASNMSLVLAAN